jgi:hypothetical protein
MRSYCTIPVLEIVCFHQAADQGQSLSHCVFFASTRSGRESKSLFAIRQFNYRAVAPKFRERINAAHLRHDIHSHSDRYRVLTPEVNSVAAIQVFQFKRRNGYNFRFQFSEGPSNCAWDERRKILSAP